MPHIICSKNPLMISLAQMRQSDGCGSVKNDGILILHFASGAGHWANIPCLLQDATLIRDLHPPKQSAKKRQKVLKKKSNFNKLHGIALAYIHKTRAKRGPNSMPKTPCSSANQTNCSNTPKSMNAHEEL